MFDRTIIDDLIQRAAPAVSLYLPLRPDQRDLRLPNAILRDAAESLAEKLQQRGMAAEECQAILDAVEAALPGFELATHRDATLAVFQGGGQCRAVPLPVELPQSISVGRHYNIKPLLPLLAQHQRFWLLALAEGRARLFSVTPFDCVEVPLPNARPEQLPGQMPPADHGVPESDALLARAPSLLDDLPALVRVVSDAIGDDPAPLLLAAEPKIGGHFRKTAGLPQLAEVQLTLNPHALSPDELKRRAVELMRPALDQPVEAALERIVARLGDALPTVAIRLEEILAAAEEGRVDTIIVAEDAAMWGSFEPGRSLVAHGHPTGTDEDLLNQAAVVTLQNGGQAYALPQARLPRGSLAAATLRF